MELWAVLFVLMGTLMASVGIYLLAFRPLDRKCGLLGIALVLTGILLAWESQIVLGERSSVLKQMIDLCGLLAFTIFVATFPRRMALRSLSGVVLLLLLARLAASLVYLATVPLTVGADVDFWGFLLHPAGIGAVAFVGLFVLCRFIDLPRSLDDKSASARYFYIVALGVVFTGGGFLVMREVFAFLGPTPRPFPLFLQLTLDPRIAALQAPPDPRIAALQALCWLVFPIAISAVALVKWRWWLPTMLMLIGAVTYVPLAFRPALDILSVVTLRSWGVFIAPLLVLYATVRWVPFAGEPRGLRPSVAMTATAATLAYVFFMVFALLLSPNATVAYIVGPIIALVATVATILLVVPRARGLGLRQAFTAAAGHNPLGTGRVILGRYRIVRLLAEGGQGQVYEAMELKANRRVVLKAASAEVTGAEARMLRDLQHPNVVRFVDIVDVTGLTLLVLEYVEGGTLRAALDRRSGKLGTRDGLRVARGVLAGLAAVHACGIAHRDVKPENVLLDAAGDPKITDFGAAREAKPGATIRVGGLGTLLYLAPEQVRGDPGDARSDVYAAAVVIHELLTGRRPVGTGAGDDFTVRKSILSDRAVLSLPKETGRLAQVVERALAKEPSQRFANAGEMLESWTGIRSIQPVPPRRVRRAVLAARPSSSAT